GSPGASKRSHRTAATRSSTITGVTTPAVLVMPMAPHEGTGEASRMAGVLVKPPPVLPARVRPGAKRATDSAKYSAKPSIHACSRLLIRVPKTSVAKQPSWLPGTGNGIQANVLMFAWRKWPYSCTITRSLAVSEVLMTTALAPPSYHVDVRPVGCTA